MNEYLGGPETAEKIRLRHERYCAMRGTGKGQMFVIVAGPAAKSVGSVGFWEQEWQGEPAWETGWSVLPEFQGRGIATGGVAAAIERARTEGEHRSIHAFPSTANLPSNAVCRKVGFVLLGEIGFEYPPGCSMRCNHWAIGPSAGTEAYDTEAGSPGSGAG